MDRDRLLSDLERQRQFCEDKSPVYAAVYAALIKDVSAGRAFWPERLLKAWSGRVFTTWYEAPGILLASLHFRSLKGDFPMEPAAAVAYLETAPDAFWDRIKAAFLQTNEVGRAPGWMLPATAAFLTHKLPFHLVDMGTSAGLTLIGDYGDRFWELLDASGEKVKAPALYESIPYPVLTRTGLDLHPLRLELPDERLWLKASIWPDHAERIERFERMADLFVRLSKERGGPKVFECDFTKMGEWVLKNVKVHPEEGLLLYNSQATDFLTDEQYAAFRAGVLKALEPWGERGLWVELEMPRGGKAEFHELTAHRLIDGRPQSKVLATLTAHSKAVQLREGWEFLMPRQPVKPRFTIEDKPVEMKPGLYTFPKV